MLPLATRNTSGTAYDAKFYLSQEDGSYRSADIIVPIVLSLHQPKTVIDVGCGLGTWARRFMESGGTLHRSFNEAKRAGLAEIKRSRSNERNVAG